MGRRKVSLLINFVIFTGIVILTDKVQAFRLQGKLMPFNEFNY